MPALVRAGMLGVARSLPISPKGRDGGEVMRSYSACGEGRDKRSWPAPALVSSLGPRSLARPRSFGLILADVLWATQTAN
jgi:hypothetical protein